MNRLETIFILFTAWLAVAFEISFPGFRQLLGFQISLLPPLMVYLALSNSLPGIVLLSLIGGVASDAFSANPIGISTLALAGTGMLLHHNRDLVLRDQAYAQVAMGLLATALVPALVVLALMNTQHPVQLTWRLFGQWLGAALAGGICTPFVFRLFALLSGWFSYQALPESHFRDTRQIKRTRI